MAEPASGAVLEAPPPSLESEIQTTEQRLGLDSEYDRLAEASLFIDKKFLSYALITGVTQHPERVFGDKAWADYTAARLFAKEYGDGELTPDFVIELHKRLTQRSDPKNSGRIRNIGVIGGSYDQMGQPIELTESQLMAIEQNPKLSFKKVPPDDEDSTTGLIIYPHQSGNIQQAITDDLAELCEWYNRTKKEEVYNPHILAALLQHRLISLHPFLDSNGRLTRVLMNWSLENDGQAPCLIDDPSEDILTDEETWVIKIRAGSESYKAVKDRQRRLNEAGIDNINALFDLGQDKAFYRYIFQYLQEAPSLPTNGDTHHHQTFEDFLKHFKEEMDIFQAYLRSTSDIETKEGSQEMTQGGFITLEFMQYATATDIHLLPTELRSQFFTEVESYRGGIIEGQIDDEKICQMFQGYVGVGTGYRALKKAYQPAVSSQTIRPDFIRESMEYYNQMFASTYFKAKHPDIPDPFGSVARDLTQTVQEHIRGNTAIWNSPFTSTSLNYLESKKWARMFQASYAQGANHGILFRTQLPREGTIMTFGKKIAGLNAEGFVHESEVLVAGGLEPASLNCIEIYDRTISHNNPALLAKRIERDGVIQIEIEDRRDQFVKTRVYTYDPKSARFELTGETSSDVLSSKPIDEPAPFDPYHVKDLFKSGKLSSLDKYQSPFKDYFNESPIINLKESYLENFSFPSLLKEFNFSNDKKESKDYLAKGIGDFIYPSKIPSLLQNFSEEKYINKLYDIDLLEKIKKK